MLVQMIHVFDDALLERRADADVVEDREVLDVLAEPDASGMRADGNAEPGRQQQHRQHLVHATEPAASIWQNPMAPACMSCLNMTRF